MKEYQKDLSAMYKYLIKESPDGIYYREKIENRYGEMVPTHYSYEHTKGAYTGLIDNSGQFVISESIVGHDLFLNRLRYYLDGEDSTFGNKIKTNVDDDNKLSDLLYERIGIRIWTRQKVFSMWENYKPSYKAAIIESIESVGLDPREFKYDAHVKHMYVDDMPTYDEFFQDKLSPEQEDKIRDDERKVREGRRSMADKMAGVKKPKDLRNTNRPPRIPSWQREEGG